MSKTTFGKNTTAMKRTAFCKICKDAGKSKEEYTSHWPRESPRHDSAVVCPTLLSQECRYCHGLGHTKKWCPILKKKEEECREARLSTQRRERDEWKTLFESGSEVVVGGGRQRGAKIRFNTARASVLACSNMFGDVSDSDTDSDAEEISATKTSLHTTEAAAAWKSFRAPRPITAAPSSQFQTEETSSAESTPTATKLTKAQRKRRKQKDRKRKRHEAAVEASEGIVETTDSLETEINDIFGPPRAVKLSWADECDSDNEM